MPTNAASPQKSPKPNRDCPGGRGRRYRCLRRAFHLRPNPASALAAAGRQSATGFRFWSRAAWALALLFPPVVAAGRDANTDGWKPLWNGRDLAGWSTWLRAPEPTSNVSGLRRDAEGKYLAPLGANRDPLGVFTVVAGVDGRPALRISGEVFGELRTADSFSDYHLRLQFKWGEKKWAPRLERPRDSGILYHVHTPPGGEGRTWARSVELQIQEGDTGDLWAVGSTIFVRSRLRAGPREAGANPIFDYDPQGPWNVFLQASGMISRCVKQPDNEKPRGEWNTVELVCLGADSIHIVNGRVVMRLHGPQRIDTPTPRPIFSGPLILQSEGAEIFYRDIEIRPIQAVPPPYAGP